jgi:hypothetical protein
VFNSRKKNSGQFKICYQAGAFLNGAGSLPLIQILLHPEKNFQQKKCSRLFCRSISNEEKRFGSSTHGEVQKTNTNMSKKDFFLPHLLLSLFKSVSFHKKTGYIFTYKTARHINLHLIEQYGEVNKKSLLSCTVLQNVFEVIAWNRTR